MSYLPDFQGGQLGPKGGSSGSFDCTAWSEAYLIDWATLGNQKTTGRAIRLLSSEPIPHPGSPGLTLPQVDAVGVNRFFVDANVRLPMDFDDWWELNQGLYGSHLQIDYSPLHGTKYDADPTFDGNHDFFVAPKAIAIDPLADGRRPGIYKYHGEAYPKSLLKEAAGELDIGGRRLGFGKAYVGYIKQAALVRKYRATVHPKSKLFFSYHLGTNAAGVYILPQPKGRVTERTGGFSATCSKPVWVRWPSENRSVELVEILDSKSAYNHWWVDAKYAKEI